MGQHLLAIDLSPSRARLVVLDASLRKTQLIAAETIVVDPQAEPDAFWRQIKSAVPQMVDSVIVTADPRAASARLLTFPFEDQRKIDAALGFELENQVPYAVEEIVTSSIVTERGQGKATVLTALSPRPALASVIAALKGVELEPRAMVMPAAALAELVPQGGEWPVAVASLGDTSCHLAVVHNGLRFARTLRTGGVGIDRVLAKRYNLSPEEARRAKESEAYLLAPGEEATAAARGVSEAVVEGLAPLLRDINTTFKSLPAGLAPQRLLITGGLSRLAGLDRYLSERLGIPVTLVDLQRALGPITSRIPGVGPEYAVAVAMALSLARSGSSIPLNLRRGDLAFHGDMQVYRGSMVRIGIGIAAVMLLAITGSIIRYSLISGEEEQIRQGCCDATKKIIGREICDCTAAAQAMKQPPGVGDVTVPSYSATEMFDMFSKIIGKDVDVTFEELEFRVNSGKPDDPDRMTGKGEAASFEAVEQIVALLKKHPCVKEAESSKQKKTHNTGRVEFNLAAKLSCPVGVTPKAAIEAAAPAPESPTAAAEPLPEGNVPDLGGVGTLPGLPQGEEL